MVRPKRTLNEARTRRGGKLNQNNTAFAASLRKILTMCVPENSFSHRAQSRLNRGRVRKS